MLMLGLFLWRWDRRQSKLAKSREQQPSEHNAGIEAEPKPAYSDPSAHSAVYLQRKAELDDEQRRHELETSDMRREMEANERHELSAAERRRKEGARGPL